MSKFINVTPTASIKQDTRCWHLRIQTGTVQTEGSVNFGKPAYETTYHATLPQCANALMEYEAASRESMEELVTYYKSAAAALTEYLNHITKTN